MEAFSAWLAAAGLSYLIGAIPFGYIVASMRGVDIRLVGSGNIGATNVLRTVGKPWGILTFCCDAMKGFTAVAVLPKLAIKLGYTGDLQILQILCATLAISGHNWPVYLKFKGGKGIATSAGVLLGLGWESMVVGLLVWLVVFVVSRYVSLASIAAAVAVPAAAWLLYLSRGVLIPAALTVLGLLAVWRHRSNIRRLLNGTENRFEFGRCRQPTADKTKGDRP